MSYAPPNGRKDPPGRYRSTGVALKGHGGTAVHDHSLTSGTRQSYLECHAAVIAPGRYRP